MLCSFHRRIPLFSSWIRNLENRKNVKAFAGIVAATFYAKKVNVGWLTRKIVAKNTSISVSANCNEYEFFCLGMKEQDFLMSHGEMKEGVKFFWKLKWNTTVLKDKHVQDRRWKLWGLHGKLSKCSHVLFILVLSFQQSAVSTQYLTYRC